MSKIPAEVQALIASAVENAVSSRPAAVAAPVVKSAPAMSVYERIGRRFQKQYVETLGQFDQNLTAAAKSAIVEKAMLQGTPASGGYLLPDEFLSSEYVEVLRDQSVLAKAGCRVVSYNKNLNVGKLATGAAAEFVAEGSAPTISSPTTANILLGHKKVAGYVTSSLEFLRNPSVNAAEIVGQDLTAALVAHADSKLLMGTGAGQDPVGLVAQTNAANKFSANATPTISTIIEELDKAEGLVRGAKVQIDGSARWIMSSATMMALKSLRDGGGWVFRDQLDQGTLNGYPVLVTEAVTADNVIFGVFSQAYLGSSAPLEMAMGLNGTDFAAGNMTTVASAGCDIKVRHDKAFAVILDTDVWSA